VKTRKKSGRRRRTKIADISYYCFCFACSTQENNNSSSHIHKRKSWKHQQLQRQEFGIATTDRKQSEDSYLKNPFFPEKKDKQQQQQQTKTFTPKYSNSNNCHILPTKYAHTQTNPATNKQGKPTKRIQKSQTKTHHPKNKNKAN
jgi:hypothetical protein